MVTINELQHDIFMNKIINKLKSKLAGKIYQMINLPTLQVEELILGHNVTIEPGVEICCKRLVLGDGVTIKSGTRIEMSDLVIGDYTSIQNNCFLSGTDWCQIGHNCWFGGNSIIDSIGTTRIGNGVGVGAHSQLWTHIYFGDILEGNRFSSHKPLVVNDDVWFVGHCIVSPIKAEERSMALAGSVVTKNMKRNHVYAGVPAIDVTKKIGHQFRGTSINKKRKVMETYLKEYLRKFKPKENRIKIVNKIDLNKRRYSQFSLNSRFYVKNLYPEEIQFMRFLLPEKAKYFPIPEDDWVSRFMKKDFCE